MILQKIQSTALKPWRLATTLSNPCSSMQRLILALPIAPSLTTNLSNVTGCMPGCMQKTPASLPAKLHCQSSSMMVELEGLTFQQCTWWQRNCLLCCTSWWQRYAMEDCLNQLHDLAHTPLLSCNAWAPWDPSHLHHTPGQVSPSTLQIHIEQLLCDEC